MMMQKQFFHKKVLLRILFIKQPSVVGGKFCFSFSYLVVNFMFVVLKTLWFSALKSRYKIGNEYKVEISAFQNMLKVIFR